MAKKSRKSSNKQQNTDTSKILSTTSASSNQSEIDGNLEWWKDISSYNTRRKSILRKNTEAVLNETSDISNVTKNWWHNLSLDKSIEFTKPTNVSSESQIDDVLENDTLLERESPKPSPKGLFTKTGKSRRFSKAFDQTTNRSEVTVDTNFEDNSLSTSNISLDLEISKKGGKKIFSKALAKRKFSLAFEEENSSTRNINLENSSSQKTPKIDTSNTEVVERNSNTRNTNLENSSFSKTSNIDLPSSKVETSILENSSTRNINLENNSSILKTPNIDLKVETSILEISSTRNINLENSSIPKTPNIDLKVKTSILENSSARNVNLENNSSPTKKQLPGDKEHTNTRISSPRKSPRKIVNTPKSRTKIPVLQTSTSRQITPKNLFHEPVKPCFVKLENITPRKSFYNTSKSQLEFLEKLQLSPKSLFKKNTKTRNYSEAFSNSRTSSRIDNYNAETPPSNSPRMASPQSDTSPRKSRRITPNTRTSRILEMSLNVNKSMQKSPEKSIVELWQEHEKSQFEASEMLESSRQLFGFEDIVTSPESSPKKVLSSPKVIHSNTSNFRSKTPEILETTEIQQTPKLEKSPILELEKAAIRLSRTEEIITPSRRLRATLKEEETPTKLLRSASKTTPTKNLEKLVENEVDVTKNLRSTSKAAHETPETLEKTTTPRKSKEEIPTKHLRSASKTTSSKNLENLLENEVDVTKNLRSTSKVALENLETLEKSEIEETPTKHLKSVSKNTTDKSTSNLENLIENEVDVSKNLRSTSKAAPENLETLEKTTTPQKSKEKETPAKHLRSASKTSPEKTTSNLEKLLENEVNVTKNLRSTTKEAPENLETLEKITSPQKSKIEATPTKQLRSASKTTPTKTPEKLLENEVEVTKNLRSTSKAAPENLEKSKIEATPTKNLRSASKTTLENVLENEVETKSPKVKSATKLLEITKKSKTPEQSAVLLNESGIEKLVDSDPDTTKTRKAKILTSTKLEISNKSSGESLSVSSIEKVDSNVSNKENIEAQSPPKITGNVSRRLTRSQHFEGETPQNVAHSNDLTENSHKSLKRKLFDNEPVSERRKSILKSPFRPHVVEKKSVVFSDTFTIHKPGMADSVWSERSLMSSTKLNPPQKVDNDSSSFENSAQNFDDSASISTNSPQISTELGPINTELGPISTKLVAISTTSPSISTKLGPISTTSPSISTKLGQISTKLAPISTTSPSISTKLAPISTKLAAISTTSPSISTNSPQISTNSPSISTNSPSISTNCAQNVSEIISINSTHAETLEPQFEPELEPEFEPKFEADATTQNTKIFRKVLAETLEPQRDAKKIVPRFLKKRPNNNNTLRKNYEKVLKEQLSPSPKKKHPKIDKKTKIQKKYYQTKPWCNKYLIEYIRQKMKASERQKNLDEILDFMVESVEIVKKAKKNYNREIVLLKKELARATIIRTHFDFYWFVDEYLPFEYREKVVPITQANTNIPKNYFDESLLFKNIL